MINLKTLLLICFLSLGFSLCCQPADATAKNESPYSSLERVYVLPISERSPTSFGVFDQSGELLYSLPYGSQPYNTRSIAPLNPAVLNRLIKLPDSSMVWAAPSGLQAIEGMDGSQIMRVARCVDSPNDLANVLYWNPNDAFCVCYRMQNDSKQKFYFAPDGSLIHPGPFSPESGPMQEGFALVKAYDYELESDSRSPDFRPWQILKTDGSLTDIGLEIYRPLSAFHQGQALVFLDGHAMQGMRLGIINEWGEVVSEIPPEIVEEMGLRSMIAQAAHGYFLLMQSPQKEDNNFWVLDREGAIVKQLANCSDLHILGPDRFLIREQGPGRNQTASVRLENLAGEVLRSWNDVRQIMPASGLDNSRLLAIGMPPNQQVHHIDEEGERIHRMMGTEAYQVGTDHYFVLRRQQRNRWVNWETQAGETYFDSRWVDTPQQWPLEGDTPLWAISSLRVREDAEQAFMQLPQMIGLEELLLPALEPGFKPVFSAPLPGLRKLRIDRATTSQLAAFLQFCPGLTELSISYLTETGDAAHLPLSEELSQVRLIVKGAAPVYGWLRRLPSLYRLSISSDNAEFLQEVESWRTAHRWNISTGRVSFDGGQAVMQEEAVMEDGGR